MPFTADFSTVDQKIFDNVAEAIGRVSSFLVPDVAFTSVAGESDPLTITVPYSEDTMNIAAIQAAIPSWDGVSNFRFTLDNVSNVFADRFGATITVESVTTGGDVVLVGPSVTDIVSGNSIGSELPHYGELIFTFDGADVAAGQSWTWECGPYLTTVRKVYPWGKSPFDIPEFPAAVVVTGEEDFEDGPLRGSNTAYTKTLMLAVDVYDRGGFADPQAEQRKLKHDVETALMLDRKRGGFALDTSIVSAEPFSFDGEPIIGVTVTASIKYRTIDRQPREYV